ncbi:hypothetical protein CHS0354_004436 [Potamilus streckersoni]|uniref:Berberine/berberine-like domain-containing protein n=1 Tax=Potamilus streckersoni TaxID=2493646 RepID=A0AAE0WB75_9BIVA|nr:hypothetical protein CHS0354_004436 [Potamilus streckersoni]
MKVVIADGRIVDCTADGSTIYHTDGTVQNTTDTDLFWALRGGGGGTYGIVVKFTYKLHYQPSQLVKMVLTVPMNVLPKPLLSGLKFLEAFNKFVHNLPDEYGGYLILDNFPSRTKAINHIGTYRLLLIKFGPWDNETENVLDPFNDCISKHGCVLKIENKTSFYDYEKDMFDIPITRVYTLGTFLQPSVFNSNFATFIRRESVLLKNKGVFMICIGTLIGGKVSQFSNDSAPIHSGFRNGFVCMTCAVVMSDHTKDKKNIAAGKRFSRQLQQYGNGVYMNEAAYDLDNWQDVFWGNHYNRLLEIKQKWDPTNFFTCHHCVGSERKPIRKRIVTCDS